MTRDAIRRLLEDAEFLLRSAIAPNPVWSDNAERTRRKLEALIAEYRS